MYLVSQNRACYATEGIGHRRYHRGTLNTRQTLGHHLLNNLVAFWPLGTIVGPLSSAIQSTMGGMELSNLANSDINVVTASHGPFGAVDLVAGNDQHLGRNSEAALQVGAGVDISFQVWVNFDALPNTAPAGAMGVICKDDAASGREYALYGSGSNAFIWRTFTGGTTSNGTLIAAGTISTGTWYHLVATYNSNGGALNLYINGAAETPATAGSTVTATATPFRVGVDSRAGAGIKFDGKMHSMGVWKRVLSQDEATYLYNNGTGRKFPFV